MLPEGFHVEWCTVWKCDSFEKHGMVHVLIGSAVVNAPWYPGPVGARSALQTKTYPDYATPILFQCSFKLQSHGRNVIIFNIVVATPRVCIEAWKPARNILHNPTSQLKPSPIHPRPLTSPPPSPPEHKVWAIWMIRRKQSQLLWWTKSHKCLLSQLLAQDEWPGLSLPCFALLWTRWCHATLSCMVPCCTLISWNAVLASDEAVSWAHLIGSQPAVFHFRPTVVWRALISLT